VLVILLITRPGEATTIRVLTPGDNTTMLAGQMVDLSWERPPAEADEMELLLEIGDGAALHLRLTPQMSGSTCSFSWRVPNLPGKVARLRLRWGQDGVETEGEPSAPFTIVADPHSPPDRVSFSCGEWWLAEPPPTFGPHRGDGAQALGGPFSPHQPAAASELNEVAPEAGPARNERSMGPENEPGAASCDHPEVSARCPLTIPLRP